MRYFIYCSEQCHGSLFLFITVNKLNLIKSFLFLAFHPGAPWSKIQDSAPEVMLGKARRVAGLG